MITSKADALELARINLENDAERYIRQIESALMVWDTKSPIKIHIPANDSAIGTWLVKEYKNKGWWPSMRRKAGSSKDFWFTLTS